jgi:TP901 family phage tail tape measure protein
MALNMGSAVAFLELDTSKFKSGFKSAISDLKVFQASGATTEQKLKGLSSAFSTVGGGLTKGLTLPLVGVGAASVGVATKFESAMSQVAATMGITTEQIKNGNKDFENLQKTALNMGATTKYTASEAAEGLNILAQAGLSADESIKAIPTVLSLASAGAMSLDSAATYVTASVKGFGDSMDNAQKYADLMAKGATLANTDVRGLGEALSGVSATANNYKQSVDSTTLSLLRLAEQNITGGEASTMLARAMADIYTPTSKAKKALDELGISAYDGSEKARDFNDIVDELSKAFAGMSDEEANATKNQIFTTYGMNAFNKMTAATTKTVDKFKTGLKDATGSAAQQAETQLDNLKGSLTLLQSALEGAGIVIGQRLTPYIRKLADVINVLVTKFNNLTDAQQDMIVKIGLVVAAIGPVMLIMSKLFKFVSMAVTAFKTFGTTLQTIKTSIDLVRAGYAGLAMQMGGIPAIISSLMAGFSGMLVPVLSVVAVIGVLVAAFVTLWKTNETFRNKIVSVFDEVKTKIGESINNIKETLSNLNIDFSGVINVLKSLWIGFCNIIAPLFTNAFQGVATVIESVMTIIEGIVQTAVGIINGDVDLFTKGIGTIFSGLLTGITGLASNILSLVGELGANILSALGLEDIAEVFQTFFETISEIFEQIPEVVNSAFETVGAFFTETLPEFIDSAVETIQGFADNVVTFFTETIPEAFNSFVELVGGIVDSFIKFFTVTIPEAFTNFVTVTLPNAINSMITFFNQIPYYLGYAIGLGIGYIAKFALGIYNFATVQLPQYIAAIIKWFSQLPSKIWTWLTQAIQKVAQFATQVGQKAQQTGSAFITAIVQWFTQLPSKVQNFLTKVVQNVTKWAASMRTKAIQAGRSFINGVVNGIKSLPSKVQQTLSNVINKLTSWVSKMHSKGVQGANQLKSGVVNTARSIPSQMVSIGANIVNGVWNGIQSMRSSFVSRVRSFFKGIVDGAKSALGIHSPSKVFDEQVGQNIVKGVIQGVNKQKKNAKKNAQQLAKLYISAGNKRLNELKKHNKYSLQLEINFWAKMLKQSKKGTAKYKKISAELSDAKKQRNKKIKALDEEYAKNVKEVQTKLNEDIQKVMSEYDSAVTSRAEQINSQLSLFKKFESQSENTKQGLIDNLQSQVSGLKDWENTLESLRKRGVATGLIEELQEAGVDSLADIKLLNSMTDTELNKYVSLWKEKQQLATKEAVREIDKTTYINQIKALVNNAGNELDKLEQTYKNDLKKLGVGVKDTSKQIGQNIVDGLKKGMKSKYPDFLKYVQKEFDKITVTAKKTLKIKSPSRVFAEIGGFIAQGVGVGFKNEMPKVNEQLETELDKLSDVNTKQINVGVSFEVYKNEFSKITESILTSMQSFVIIMKNTFENMLDGLGSIKEDMADILEMLEQLNEMNNATFERISDQREKVDKTKEQGTDKADRGGDTFNFYNTKPNPYEYSRQMKKAKKELLYGI